MSRQAMQFVEALLTQDCVDAAHGRFPGVETGSKKKDRPIAIRVFKNSALEIFGKAHWVTPIIWFGPLITFGLYRGFTSPWTTGWRTVALFLAGWLIWTLLEYVLHRFLFHLEAKGPADKVRVFLMHGYHHDFPDDPMHLVAPPMMSWGPAIIVATIFYFAFGAHYWLPIMAGTAAGYVAYDWIHYYTHHGRPTWALGKFLRRYHMKHHFKDGDAWYGVSSPLWDYVLGTQKSKLESDSAEAAAQH